jgi:hypothetical protein
MNKDAARYEARCPETGVGEAQAAERQQRRDFREEVSTHRRTGRTRGIVVPALPWLKED